MHPKSARQHTHPPLPTDTITIMYRSMQVLLLVVATVLATCTAASDTGYSISNVDQRVIASALAGMNADMHVYANELLSDGDNAEATNCTNDVGLQLFKFEQSFADSTGARCLDGSPAGYYHSLNASSSDWLIWLQGGGLCVEMIDCLMRAKTPLGSSTHWASCHRKGDNATSMLGSNPDNPFASFNRIYIPYCSGDTWAGNSTAKNPRMGELYTSGHVVLDVILDHLSATAGLNAAKRVLLTGASAGGIGTFINADFVAQRLSNAVVKAAPQGGWYLPNLAELYYEWDLGIHVPIGLFFGTYVGAQFDCYLNQRCMADMRAAHKDPHVCWDVTVHYPYIETQLLVIENQFDANQIFDIMLTPNHHTGSDPNTGYSPASVTKFIQFYGGHMKTSIEALAVKLGPAKGNGVFFPSCVVHVNDLYCVTGTGPRVQGQTLGPVLKSWFDNPRSSPPPVLVDTCVGTPVGAPCNTHCTCKP